MRPDEDEQFAASSLLAYVRSQEQRKRGRIEKRHRAQVDRDAAHSALGDVPIECRQDEAVPAPLPGRVGVDGLCERMLELGGAVEIELAGEREDGRPAGAARQDELEVRRCIADRPVADGGIRLACLLRNERNSHHVARITPSR